MGFSAIYLHFVWATYTRQPLITPQIERLIVEMIHHKSDELKVRLCAVNTVADHLHLACCFPARLSASDYVKNLKGTSSYMVNHSSHVQAGEPRFRWQEQFGVFSFGERSLPIIQEYIARQKEHHLMGTFNDYYERIE